MPARTLLECDKCNCVIHDTVFGLSVIVLTIVDYTKNTKDSRKMYLCPKCSIDFNTATKRILDKEGE